MCHQGRMRHAGAGRDLSDGLRAMQLAKHACGARSITPHPLAALPQAMKLVAAAKVRRAQEAVINSRPFTESLVKVRVAAA
jgi:hypothetical protein